MSKQENKKRTQGGSELNWVANLSETPDEDMIAFAEMKNDESDLDAFLEEAGLTRKKFLVQHDIDFQKYCLDNYIPDRYFHQNGECRLIETRFIIESVSDVSTINGTFAVQYRITLDWKPSRAEVKEICQAHANTLNPELLEFRPKLYPAATEATILEDWSVPELSFQKKEKCQFELKTSQLMKCTFQERFELENFPMDCQDLCMEFGFGIASTKDTTIDKARFIPQQPDGSKAISIVRENIQETDFRYINTIAEYLTTDPSDSRYSRQYSKIHIRIKIQRQWKHYFYRLCFVLSLVTLSGTIAFLFDIEENFPDACAYMSTCLLTVVAFMFVVQSTLPAIGYLTFLDEFVVTLLTYVVFQIVLLSLFSFGIDGLEAQNVFYASLAFWLLIHIFYGVRAKLLWDWEAQKLKMNGKEIWKLHGESGKTRQYILSSPKMIADYVGVYK